MDKVMRCKYPPQKWILSFLNEITAVKEYYSSKGVISDSKGSMFRVPCCGFRVPGSMFRVPGSGFRVLGPMFRVPCSGSTSSKTIVYRCTTWF
jgi:hypothetical protein